MSTKSNLLIVLSTQFGYHTDTYMYAKYLNKSVYNVHYVCFDTNLPKIELPDITVHYIPCHKSKYLRYFYYFFGIKKITNSIKFNLVFHVHTKFSFLIRTLFSKKKYIFDIRTGDLNENFVRKYLKNLIITSLMKCTKNTTIISEALAKELNVKINKTHVIPLGGDKLEIPSKNFTTINLLYVGTLTRRNIHETIIGLSKFICKDYINLTYDIIGDGYASDVKKIKDTIIELGLQQIVKYHGYVKHSQLLPYFTKANIGIVYIPQKKYFEYQPSTKLFEYLLAGLPVIATNTHENKKRINPSLGILCNDNPDAFCSALENLKSKLNSFDSHKIKNQMINFTWENIVRNNLEPYLQSILDD